MNKENAGVDEEVVGADDEQELNEDSRAPEDQEDDTDWKAIALKERERGDNYKIALDQKRGLRKGKAPTPESDDEADDDGDKPISRNEFERILQDTVVPIIASNKVDTILAEKVKDPAKREAVKIIYENRVRQTGTSDEAVRSDVDAAIAIANSHRNRVAAGEIERAGNRDTTPPLNGSGADRGTETKGHKFSADQVKILEAKAATLGADPKEFIKKAWLTSRRS